MQRADVCIVLGHFIQGTGASMDLGILEPISHLYLEPARFWGSQKLDSDF